jgi:hypothetical protein
MQFIYQHEGTTDLLKFQNDNLSRFKTDFKLVFYMR